MLNRGRNACVLCIIGCALVLTACESKIADNWHFEENWVAGEVFASPESAIYEPISATIFVSNVNGYEKNGKGYISALTGNGEVLEKNWIDGLNAPTGMAINGPTLLVVDFDRVAAIDIKDKNIRDFYDAPDAKPGLNDITINPDKRIFVSASELGAIYELMDGKLELWIQDEQLKWANGVYANTEYLYVAGFHMNRIGLNNKIIEPIGDQLLLEDLESIETDGDDGFFLTQIGEKPILHLSSAGEITTVLERSTYSADVDFVDELDLLIVPSGGGEVVGFTTNAKK